MISDVVGSTAGLPIALGIVLLLALRAPSAGIASAIALACAGGSSWTIGAGIGVGLTLMLFRVRLQPMSAAGRRIFGLAMLFFGWAVISWMLNGAPSSSVGNWLAPMAVRLAFVYTLIRISSTSMDVPRVAMRGVVIGAALEGLVGIAQKIGLVAIVRVAWSGPGVAVDRITGTETDPNYFAITLAIGISFALVLLSIDRSRAAGLAMIVSAVGIILSLSRSGLLALVSVFFVWLAARVVRKRGSLRRSGRIFLPVAVMVAAVFVAGPSSLIARFSQVGGDVQFSSAEQRVVLWRAARIVIGDHAVVGVGPDQVRYAMYSATGGHVPHAAIGARPLSAHNTILDITADLGFVGLAIWAVLLFVTMRLCWQRFRSSLQPELFVGAAGAVVGFFVAGMFVTAVFTLPFWLALAIICWEPEPIPGATPRPKTSVARRR